MADLAMLFPALLTNAYRVEDQRREQMLHRDLEKMGVSVEEFRQIGHFWQAAVVPETMQKLLRIVLERTGLINRRDLYRIPEASLSRIIEAIALDMMPLENSAQIDIH